MILRTFTLVYDSREKLPLKFPNTMRVLDPHRPCPPKSYLVVLKKSKQRLDEHHAQLNKGDYFIEGYPDRVVIERKRGIDELAMNCLNPRRRSRIVDEMKYLAGRCEYPVWFVEGTPTTLLRGSRRVDNPGIAIDALTGLLYRYRIPMWLINTNTPAQRLAAGEMAARLLLRGVIT
jgi:ERCC4-type nuclease